MPGYLLKLTACGLTAAAVVAAGALPVRAYEVVAVRDGGKIEGKVVFRESRPRAKKIIPTKNAEVCGEIREEPQIALAGDGGVQDAVVYLKEVGAGKAWGEHSKHAVLDNVGCKYVPSIQVVPTGATLEIVNSDPILHTVHGFMESRTIFNDALWKQKHAERLLDTAGLVRVDCEVHGWMRAWVEVVGNPYYATTSQEGSFTMTDVPPGNYTLVAWHEYTGATETPVVVKAGETLSLTADLKKQGEGQTAAVVRVP